MKTRPSFLLPAARVAVTVTVAIAVVPVAMYGAPRTSAAAASVNVAAHSSGPTPSTLSTPAPATAGTTSPAVAARAGCTKQTDFSDVVSQGPLCQSGKTFVVRLRNAHDVTVAPPDTIAGLLQAGAVSAQPAAAAPVSSVAAAAPPFASACVTNGQSQRVILIYAHFAGQGDNAGSDTADIENQFNQVDSNFINYDASTYFGVSMHLRVECTSSLQLQVHDLALSTSINQANFSTIVSDAQAAGYCVSGSSGGCSAAGAAHYWIWTDGNPTSGYAGQSSVIGDDSTGINNAINSSDAYSVNYGFNAGNSGASIFAHENGHAMGAVQLSAPDSTGAWHCTDGHDVMCYNDGGPSASNYTASDCGFTPNGTSPFDCNFNDYFNPNPAPGSYLSNHWDIGSSYNEWLDFQRQNSTTTVSAPSGAVYTQPVTLTANVSGSGGPTPSGTVRFLDGSTNLGTANIGGGGTAQLQTSALSVGSHTITATYSGSGEYNGSTSSATRVSITQASTQTQLTPSANPAGATDPVTLAATVSAVSPATGVPSGTVIFTSDGSSLGTATLTSSGRATLTTSWSSVGSHQLQATYAATTGFAASSSTSFTETILTGATVTLTSTPAGSGTPTVGTSITLRASVAPQQGSGTPSGTVTFYDGGAPIGGAVPLSSGVATLTTTHFGPGSNPLTATYSGDSTFAPATASTTQMVTGGGLQVLMTPSNQQLVFWQGTNRDLYEDWFTPGLGWSGPVDWSAQLSSPGGMASAPAVTLTPGGQQLVFWRGTNNDLWEAWFTPGIGWLGPVDYSNRLGGGATVGSAPQVELTPGGQQLVFWQGTNHDLWEAWFTPGIGWAGPVDYSLKLHGGATVASTPDVVLTPGGQQLVFWQGTNNALWEAWFTPGVGWSGPVDFSAGLQAPDNVASTPSVSLTSGGQQLVFWQGTNDDLWEAWFTPSIGWAGPVDLSANLGATGNVASAPAVLNSGGVQLVFWTGTNGHLWEAWFTGSWNGPDDLTPSLTPGTAVGTAPSVALTGDGQQVVFWESPQVTLGEWWFDSNGAHGPVSLSAA